MNQPKIEVVANYHCIIGENPLYNSREQRIYWEDIESGRLFRADHVSGVHECFYQGAVMGGFSFQDDGSLLLFEANRIALLNPENGDRRVVQSDIDSDMVRFNDCIADPRGRVFVGTIGKTRESGGLYRVDLDGSIRCLWKGTQIANGMGFSSDLTRFYWTCSTSARIYVADYDLESGALENRRLFYAAPATEGTPDGMTVDVADDVWSTRWDGSSVLRISPTSVGGQVAERIEFPVAKVSSVTFGGPELDTLYVTTAGGRPGSDSADGTLYRVRVAARGRPEYFSRIQF